MPQGETSQGVCLEEKAVKIHEYQAKSLLSKYGVPVPQGGVARTPAEARKIAVDLGDQVVVKAQIHAGGRGKAGGIKTVNSAAEAERVAATLLGSPLRTHQTGPEGMPVSAVLVEEAAEFSREIYLGIVVDSAVATPLVMASEAGGMEIEEIAAQAPEKIIHSYAEPRTLEFQAFRARELAFGLNLSPEQIRPITQIVSGLYRLFVEKDCSLAEINPLAVSTDGRILALDAKLNFDDNALYRHPDIADLNDPEQENPLEVQAKSQGIANYIKMEGNIGIIVNGAGLAMAVMDAIKHEGGKPANFLDIGTVNKSERVVNAFRILTSDPGVKCILVNIFGGMARVNVIAAGLVEAYRQMEIKVPVVVRLKGTNAAEGEQIIAESGIKPIRADTFQEAIKAAVTAASTK